MKSLILLRHAKSSWDDPSLADFDRPLAPRGLKAAQLMGRELVNRDWLPDRALVSPAARTRQTWQLVARELAETPTIDFRDALYEASVEKILAEVRQAPERGRTLMVLGHNPGLEDFARQLAGDRSEAKAIERLKEKFPTAALARFVFEGKWQELDLGGARLTHCLRPKDME